MATIFYIPPKQSESKSGEKGPRGARGFTGLTGPAGPEGKQGEPGEDATVDFAADNTWTGQNTFDEQVNFNSATFLLNGASVKEDLIISGQTTGHRANQNTSIILQSADPETPFNAYL